METIDLLRQHITVTQELLEVVKIMKTLAAVNIRQYLRAVASMADYQRTVEMGLQIFLRRQQAWSAPESSGSPRLGAVLFGSEMGMCGQFNEQLVSFALEKIPPLAPRPADRLYLVVGHRVLARLEEAGVGVSEFVALPGTVAGIVAQVQGIVFKLVAWQEQLGVDRIILFHQQLISKGHFQPQLVNLLPLDSGWLAALARRPWPNKGLPTYTMAPGPLFSGLLHQWFFVLLHRAFAESLASENASRLAAMQLAEDNITNRLADLRLSFNQMRQTAITEELLDIVSGYEALTDQNQFEA
jgi:F-type H+-transporting ATPase subunit gamma